MSQGIIQIIGMLVVSAVALQVLVTAASAVRRFAANNEASRVSLDLLRIRAESALQALHIEQERVELGWSGSRKFEIHHKEREVEGVHSFELVPHDGKKLPPFLPGQFLTFELKIPGHTKPVIRCYSLSDCPNAYKYRVTIKKIPPPPDDPGGKAGLSSSYFNNVLQQDDILDVRAPSGHFHLIGHRDLPIILIGGGIGITPVLSMLNALCQEGRRSEIWFFYGVRNSAEHVMKTHLETIAQEFDNIRLHVCYSDPLDSDIKGQDYQHPGHVSVDLFKRLLPSNNYMFYICGPPPMMDSLTSGLYDWGVPKEHVHFEAFGKATVTKTAKSETGADAGKSKTEIDVAFERSGKTLKWSENRGSLLDLAEENGIPMDFDCRTGNCGTCITAIKEGEVEYLVEPGHQVENGSCLTCIGVPTGPLKIDA